MSTCNKMNCSLERELRQMDMCVVNIWSYQSCETEIEVIGEHEQISVSHHYTWRGSFAEREPSGFLAFSFCPRGPMDAPAFTALPHRFGFLSGLLWSPLNAILVPNWAQKTLGEFSWLCTAWSPRASFAPDPEPRRCRHRQLLRDEVSLARSHLQLLSSFQGLHKSKTLEKQRDELGPRCVFCTYFQTQ